MLGHVLMRTSATPSQIHKTRQTSNHRTGHVRPRSLAFKKKRCSVHAETVTPESQICDGYLSNKY